MGIEYRISCTPEGLSNVGELLGRLGGQPSAEFPAQIEFRFRSSRAEEMPDATVVLEPAGIYFVDHGGACREAVAVLLRRIMDEALTFSDSSDSVVITSL
jgi:hypothetical protein